jgi:hypothetical protein
MRTKNQIVVISGILALLATAATAAASSYIVQPAKAACNTQGGTQPYGSSCVSQEANPNLNGGNTGQNGFGGAVSTCTQGAGQCSGVTTQPGIGQVRASGCGGNDFPTVHGSSTGEQGFNCP